MNEKNTLFGQTDIEKLAEEYHECNEITRRIIDLGLTQRQLLKLVELISLNIDDVKKMQQLCAVVDELTAVSDRFVPRE